MHGNAGDAWNAWKFKIWMVFGLSQGHDPGHSDVHGQKLCDTVQEGGVHTSIAADATSVPLQAAVFKHGNVLTNA